MNFEERLNELKEISDKLNKAIDWYDCVRKSVKYALDQQLVKINENTTMDSILKSSKLLNNARMVSDCNC